MDLTLLHEGAAVASLKVLGLILARSLSKWRLLGLCEGFVWVQIIHIRLFGSQWHSVNKWCFRLMVSFFWQTTFSGRSRHLWM